MASVEGSSRLEYTSSSHANSRIPTAAGQRPSHGGDPRGSGGRPPPPDPATKGAARAAAPPRVKAPKTLPNSKPADARPTPNGTQTKGGAAVAPAPCPP